MKTANLISVDEFCVYHGIDQTFIHALQQIGLIELTRVETSVYIYGDELPQLEKFVRLYAEFNINVEGIETVALLLERITSLQDEIVALKNRLRLYEDIG